MPRFWVLCALALFSTATAGNGNLNNEMQAALDGLWSSHDIDQDGFVSKGPEVDGLIGEIGEIQTQALAMGGANPDLDYTLSIDVFDGDGDGRITSQEFVEAIVRRQSQETLPPKKKTKKKDTKSTKKDTPEKEQFAEEKVEYTTVDGEKKSMTQKELLEKMKEQQEIFQQVNGEMEKEDSGEMSMEDIAEKKPDLDRFIKVGRFAFDTLQNAGHLSEFDLKGLNSSPHPGWASINQEMKDDYTLTEAKTWVIKLSLVSKEGSTMVDDVEAIVAFHKGLQELILVRAWKGAFKDGEVLFTGNVPTKLQNSTVMKQLLALIKPWLTPDNVAYVQAGLFALGACMLALSIYMYTVLGEYDDVTEAAPKSEKKKAD